MKYNLKNKDDCHLQRLLRPARRMLLEGETISSITAINQEIQETGSDGRPKS